MQNLTDGRESGSAERQSHDGELREGPPAQAHLPTFWNGQAISAGLDLTYSWTEFLSHRWSSDLELWRNLVAAKDVTGVAKTWHQFQTDAASDYINQNTKCMRLLTKDILSPPPDEASERAD